MSMIIRYKVVGGAEGEDLRTNEAEARTALDEILHRYEARGHQVSHIADEYVVQDRSGDLVAIYELIH